MSIKTEILVIGGGVIGVSAAYFLAREGFEVTLVEASEIASGSSQGNAGLLLPSHIIPLASPGTLGKGLNWLLDPESPFYIKPRLSLELLSWLWRFRNACQEPYMRRSMDLLKQLNELSVELYEDLAKLTNLGFGYQQKGHIKLFISHEGLKEAEYEQALMAEYGVESEIMELAQLKKIEPNLKPHVMGGHYFPHDAHLIPAEFVVGLSEKMEEIGVRVETSTEVLAFQTAGSSITGVVTTKGAFKPSQVVLAGGAWSPELSKSLKLRLPIQAAKGYSLTYKTTETTPKVPLILNEANVAATPMGDTFRLAGTLELAGLDMEINQRRVNAIVSGAKNYLPGIDNLELIEIWRGLRPCMPDGLPVIGRPAKYRNLIIAAGHAMMGMGLGPVTGKLVSEIAANKSPSINLDQLKLERFQ